MEDMPDNMVRCSTCGNVIGSAALTEEFQGACPWCLGGLPIQLSEGTVDHVARGRADGRRPTDVEQLSPRTGPLPCDEPLVEMPPEVRAAPPDARFGRYIRVSQLGTGAMGEVWKAWDPALGRWVALKFLKMEDPRELAWFQREAHMAATLNHPHIAAIHDIGEDQGRHYIAMQFVEGRTLEDLAGTDPRRLAGLARDAARALAHAHARGIVHRDIKPANLMVSGADHLYVMDFGLARRIDAPSKLSLPGMVVGTPAYMSPAQARGETIDARADVYSLGATLYELLARRMPIEGLTINELLENIERGAVRPLTEAPPELASIVMKCLAADANARYAGAAELADDLDRWLAGKPVAAHSTGVAYRARKLAARQIVAVAAIALALAGIAAAGVHFRRESRLDAAYVDAMARGQSAWDEAVRYSAGTVQADLARRKAADARAHFESALAARERAPAHLMRGRCLQMEGRIDEAIDAWRKAQQLDPQQDDPRFDEAKAVVLKYHTSRGRPPAMVGRSGDKPDAGTRVEVKKDTRPETPEQKELREKAEALLAAYSGKEHQSALLRGVMAVAAYEFEKGAELLEQYTKAEPWDAQAMRLEATAWYYANKPKQARAAAQRAVERTQDVETFKLLGQVCVAADDDEAAIDAFTKAIELDPRNALLYSLRTFPCWRTGRNKQIVEDSTRMIELDPKNPRGYNSRINPSLILGDLDGAMADAEKLIELAPKQASSYTQRAFVRSRKKDFDGAIADMTKAIELDPPNLYAVGWRAVMWRNKGDALKAAGQAEQAVDAWKQALADHKKEMEGKPGSAILTCGLSELLRLVGDETGAEAAFKDAVKLQPRATSNYYFNNLGHPAYVKRQWKEAADYLRRAIAADPLKPGQDRHYVWLARAWMGEQEDATRELADVIDNNRAPLTEEERLLARFLIGRVTEQEFIKAADSADEKKTRERRCEAFCYAAEKRLIGGDREGARALYQRCVDLDFKIFIETRVAKARLAELDGK